MMKWGIVTDSSCDLMTLEAPAQDTALSSVPFAFHMDGKEHIDLPDMDMEAFVAEMEQCHTSHSACPAPAAWCDAFAQAEQNIAITISSQLSGSFNSANTAREMTAHEHPQTKVEIIDSCSTGPTIALLVRHINQLIQKGLPFDHVVQQAKAYGKSLHTLFALSSFGNLVRNGRVSRTVGLLASALNFRIIGIGSPEGKIEMKEKVRGEKKMLSAMVKDMYENHFSGGIVAISHCLNRRLALDLADKIRETWNSAQIIIMPTRGLCSYYAERNGLIVSY